MHCFSSSLVSSYLLKLSRLVTVWAAGVGSGPWQCGFLVVRNYFRQTPQLGVFPLQEHVVTHSARGFHFRSTKTTTTISYTTSSQSQFQEVTKTTTTISYTTSSQSQWCAVTGPSLPTLPSREHLNLRKCLTIA